MKSSFVPPYADPGGITFIRKLVVRRPKGGLTSFTLQCKVSAES
jgi:hypothetical protein